MNGALGKLKLSAHLSIKSKVAALVIGATFVGCLSVGLLSYQIGKDSLVRASELRLSMIAQNESETLKSQFRRIDPVIRDLSLNNTLAEAVDSMSDRLKAEHDDILAHFQGDNRPEADRVATLGDQSKLTYSKIHAGIHELIARAWRDNQLSDIYLMHNDGTVIYSVTKGPELLTNVDEDPALGPLKALKESIDAQGDDAPDELSVSDFVAYAAADGSQSIFFGRPLYRSAYGMRLKNGIVAARIGTAKLTALVTDYDKDSAVDESMLIKPDGTLRTARMMAALDGKVPADLAAAARAGKRGATFVTDSGEDFYYAYEPVNVLGTAYLMAVGQKASSILADAHHLAWSAFWVTVGVMAVMALIGAFVSGSLTKPLVRLSELMNRLNAGDTDIEVAEQDRHDEIGTMAAALQSFKSNALEKARIEGDATRQAEQAERDRARREQEKAAAAEQLQHAVDALAKGLKEAASGNLSARIETPFVGALDQLRTDFNHSMEQLDSALADIGANSETIHDASAALSKAAEKLSRRTESQASAIEEAAAALTEITETVRSSSERAEEAGAKATDTKGSAERSVGVVGSAVTAMDRIEESSRKVRNIIGVIDEIAFQTNLLALNAGVEAARAGEAGKGFAVVAQEVRELAQRSSGAAKEISELINTSTAQVETGVGLVKQTGEALALIQGNIDEIHAHVQAIIETSREQRGGIEEINVSVTEMDRSTQQNAAMAEETAASIAELARKTDELNRRVASFVTSKSLGQRHRSAA